MDVEGSMNMGVRIIFLHFHTYSLMIGYTVKLNLFSFILSILPIQILPNSMSTNMNTREAFWGLEKSKFFVTFVEYKLT